MEAELSRHPRQASFDFHFSSSPFRSSSILLVFFFKSFQVLSTRENQKVEVSGGVVGLLFLLLFLF